MAATKGTRHVRDPYTSQPKSRGRRSTKADKALADLQSYNAQMAADADVFMQPDVLADVRAQGVDTDDVAAGAAAGAAGGAPDPAGASPTIPGVAQTPTVAIGGSGGAGTPPGAAGAAPGSPGAAGGVGGMAAPYSPYGPAVVAQPPFGTAAAKQDAARQKQQQQQAAAAEKARIAQQSLADAARERAVATGQSALQTATYGATSFRDHLASLPTPGGIGALIAIQLLLVLCLLPVNGLPRIVWLWLVITRHATLIGRPFQGGVGAVGKTSDSSANIGGAIAGAAVAGAIGEFPWIAGLLSDATSTVPNPAQLFENLGGDLVGNLSRYTSLE